MGGSHRTLAGELHISPSSISSSLGRHETGLHVASVSETAAACGALPPSREGGRSTGGPWRRGRRVGGCAPCASCSKRRVSLIPPSPLPPRSAPRPSSLSRRACEKASPPHAREGRGREGEGGEGGGRGRHGGRTIALSASRLPPHILPSPAPPPADLAHFPAPPSPPPPSSLPLFLPMPPFPHPTSPRITPRLPCSSSPLNCFAW